MRKIQLALWAIVLATCTAGAVSQPAATVNVNQHTLFVLHSGMGSISVTERAQLVNQRLRYILKSSPATINAQMEKSDLGWIVLVNGTPVISVTQNDARAEKLSTKELAARWSGIIQEGLRHAREERSRQTLWRRIALTALIIILCIAGLWGLKVGWRRTARFLDERRERIPSVRFRGLELVSETRLHSGLRRSIGFIFALTALLVLTTALLLIFGQFPATRSYAREVFSWIWNPFLEIMRGIVHYLPDLFYILVIIAVSRLILRVITFVFEQAHRGTISLEPWVHRDVARPTSQILKAIVIILTLFFIAPLVPGTGSTAAKGISVILGLMVSFGATSTVGNLIAGIVLTYMRPYQLGDRVKIADATGDVTERAFLYTKILTTKNEEVMVPSLQALSQPLVNYTARARAEGLILHTGVTIGYSAPWRKVHELLLQAADRTSHLLKSPKPFVLQTALNDFYVSYQLNVYTNRANEMTNIYAELHQNIQDAFNEGGIEICSPHYHQLRDGNPTTIPSDYLQDYEPPRFLVDARTQAS